MWQFDYNILLIQQLRNGELKLSLILTFNTQVSEWHKQCGRKWSVINPSWICITQTALTGRSLCIHHSWRRRSAFLLRGPDRWRNTVRASDWPGKKESWSSGRRNRKSSAGWSRPPLEADSSLCLWIILNYSKLSWTFKYKK